MLDTARFGSRQQETVTWHNDPDQYFQQATEMRTTNTVGVSRR